MTWKVNTHAARFGIFEEDMSGWLQPLLMFFLVHPTYPTPLPKSSYIGKGRRSDPFYTNRTWLLFLNQTVVL